MEDLSPARHQKKTKMLLSGAISVLRHLQVTIRVLSIVMRSKTSPIPEIAGLENKSLIVLSIHLITIISATLSASVFAWHHSFPNFLVHLRIWIAIKDNAFVALQSPILFLSFFIFAVVAGITILTKTLRFGTAIEQPLGRILYSALGCIATFATMVTWVTETIVTKSLMAYENTLGISSRTIVFSTTLSGVLLLAICTHVYAKIFRDQVKISSGINDEVYLINKRILYLTGAVVFSFFIVCTSFLAETWVTASDQALSEQNKKMFDAKKTPITSTVNHCMVRADQIICALTIVPQELQNYTIYGVWIGAIEIPQDKNNNTTSPQVIWTPSTLNNGLIPTFHLEPGKLLDLELIASKLQVCELEQLRTKNYPSSSVSFKVVGRSDEYNLPRKIDLRIRTNNMDTFEIELLSACKT